MNYFIEIRNLEREVDTGKVIRVIYQFTGELLGNYIIRLENLFLDGNILIPFENLQESDVLGWIEAKGDIEQIKDEARSQLENRLNPATICKVPW
jgi:hypothetical protein